MTRPFDVAPAASAVPGPLAYLLGKGGLMTGPSCVAPVASAVPVALAYLPGRVVS